MKPSLQINEMEHDFQLHKRYSEGMRRLVKKKTAPKHGGKIGALPPLHSTTEGTENDGLQLATDLNQTNDFLERDGNLEESKKSKTIDVNEQNRQKIKGTFDSRKGSKN